MVRTSYLEVQVVQLLQQAFAFDAVQLEPLEVLWDLVWDPWVAYLGEVAA